MLTELAPINIAIALGVTLLAGLSTGIGGAIALFAKTTNTRLLAISLGFAAGVMIYVSFVEILVKARESLVAPLGEAGAAWAAVAGFFGGMAVIAVIDKLVPLFANPHEPHRVEETTEGASAEGRIDPRGLGRIGVLTALAIAIHNFPEGLATFLASVEEPSVGVAIAIAIAIHNIPEGIAVAVPVFYASGDRLQAFLAALTSGLAEPLGALLGFLVLWQVVGPVTFGVVFAAVAGVMVFISIDQLLPAARKYGEHHLTVYGLVAGKAVMAASLLLLSA